MGLWKDLSNFRYTTQRFRLAVADPVLQAQYSLKMTWLGVMYTIRKFPVGTPEQYIGELLAGELLLLDQGLTAMNLDGTFYVQTRHLGDDEQDTFYLVKFVPVVTTTVRYLLLLVLVWGIGSYFAHESWPYTGPILTALWDRISSQFLSWIHRLPSLIRTGG